MTGRSISGSVRLDNRGELLRALEVPNEDSARLSDLALILKAYERWSEACVSRLLGDFAFAVRDERTGRTFGARDPMGVKPFYYRASERRLAFATRASAIPDDDGLPLELNEARIADVCVPALECVDDTSTFYRGVHRLPPGHRLVFDGGRANVARYWSPDPSREIRLGSDADYVDAFREVFAEAVRCRSSGSAASMLSGGLDSSAIVGFARSEVLAGGCPPLITLSALTGDPKCEESRHIRSMLGLPGLDPKAVRPEEVGDFRGEIERFVASLEEPFDQAMMIPLLLYATARRHDVSAVLDGVDGDVVASHEPDVLASLLREGRWVAALELARGFAGFYRGTYEPWSSAPRLLAENAFRAFAPPFVRSAVGPLRRSLGARAARASSWIGREFASKVDVCGRLRTLWEHRAGGPGLTVRERQARELTHPQIAAALERYHRVAASQGIESRHPFLDKRVVEFCLALPREQKIGDGWSKRIVRRSAQGLLPDDVRWRRGRWVRLGPVFLDAVVAQFRELIAGELDGSMSEIAPYADVPALRRLLERHRRGESDAGHAVWTAAVLSFWLRKTRSRRYDASVSANGPAALPRVSLTG